MSSSQQSSKRLRSRRQRDSARFSATLVCLFVLLVEPSYSFVKPNNPMVSNNTPISGQHSGAVSRRNNRRTRFQKPNFSTATNPSFTMTTCLSTASDTSSWSNPKSVPMERFSKDGNGRAKNRVRKKYQRKRIPETERERRRLRNERQAKYEQVRSKADGDCPSLWSFESLFPRPVWDQESIEQDLFSVKKRDQSVERDRQPKSGSPPSSLDDSDNSSKKSRSKLKTSAIGASSMMRVWREPKLSSFVMPYTSPDLEDQGISSPERLPQLTDEEAAAKVLEPSMPVDGLNVNASITERIAAIADANITGKVNYELTRLVEDRIYGYRRGSNVYETSLMGDGAVQFREGVRLGNPLPVNAARLNYYGKKELRNNRVEEAQEMYETAIQIDPRDGRAYLGLSRCAQRRRDFTLAKKILTLGIANSVSVGPGGVPDNGGNPFLLQALGVLEERAGNLARAENLYIEAARSRPSHAAAWVALGQLRTVKFRQGAAAGRACFQAAERELNAVGEPPNAHVYTAWASMEYKKAGDIRRSRNLYRLALKADKRCSAAWLQLGVMEANNENWQEAQICFETILKFDQRNTRALQAYALMEARRPGSQSRKVIDLFEKALKINPRDAGVLQPYALYVAELGDIDAARELLRQGTEVNKRHAPVWQAWGVLETRQGNSDEARNIFQEGIWACAQLTGGQSGGYSCARLWQAWGVLEAQEGDYPAARRCFSRALDADKRNIAAITAWTLMEEEIGNLKDARQIFERALHQFAPETAERKRLWRSYELMEQRMGNYDGAQEVYNRAVRESILDAEDGDKVSDIDIKSMAAGAGNTDVGTSTGEKNYNKNNKEIEVVRWDQGSSSMKAEVWLNDGSIEGMVPESTMKKLNAKKE